MKTEYARIRTSDGLELQGLFFSPDGGYSHTTVIHVHGLSGNFYENRFVEIVADAVTRAGMNFMSFNNRGHEYIADIIHQHNGPETATYREIGGAFERFEECQVDIRAYIDYARKKGTKRIILEGHSHGAIKVTLFNYLAKMKEISGLILLSPSDDFDLQRSVMGNRFDSALETAKDMIDNGREGDLMPREFFKYYISAGTYFDTFRPDSPVLAFNLSGTDRKEFPELAIIKLPVLAVVGTDDEAFLMGPGDYLATMEARMLNAVSFEGHVISGAPHNYLGYEDRLAELISGWLGNL
jgi:pimeloyl-ACP methyl ester carboxylesterase